jgi:hypothetical protein
MNISNKHKIGNCLYFLPIVLIFACILYVLLAKDLPSKRLTFGVVSLLVFLSTLSSLFTDDIGVRGFGAVKKSERPGTYWTQFAMQCLLVVVCFVLAIMVKE